MFAHRHIMTYVLMKVYIAKFDYLKPIYAIIDPRDITIAK